MQSTYECIKELLNDIHPEIDFTKEKNLAKQEILDSFDTVTLISDIYDKLGVLIPSDEITPENFYSLDTIVSMADSLIKRK